MFVSFAFAYSLINLTQYKKLILFYNLKNEILANVVPYFGDNLR